MCVWSCTWTMLVSDPILPFLTGVSNKTVINTLKKFSYDSYMEQYFFIFWTKITFKL